jgi:ribosomal subunit interface protein
MTGPIGAATVAPTRNKEAAQVDVLDLEVSVTHGDVPDVAKQYAVDKVTQLARYTRRPIVYALLRLSLESNRAIERPAVAEATLDLGGPIVRAHVAARDPMAAVDLLDDRLRRRLGRQGRRGNRGQHDRNGSPSSNGWRHGDRPTERPEFFDRPVEEREVVRHKTFALEQMTCDEAAWDLDMLGHDFYLFTEIQSGREAVIFHTDDGRLGLMRTGPAASTRSNNDTMATDVSVSTQHPPELSLADAEERLDSGHEAFVFFIHPDTQRGHVVYRRYDGHYGLITPA